MSGGRDLVGAVALLELLAALGLLGVYLLIAVLRGGGREPARSAALRALLLALERAEGSTPPELRALARADRLRVILRAAAVVSGAAQVRLRAVAAGLGLRAAAARDARSRWWWRRLEAARICAALGDPEATFVRPLLRDRSAAVRAQAVEWALADPGPTTLAALLDLLDDPAALCRFAVRDTLVRIGSGAAPALAAHLARRSGPAAHAGLIVAGALGDPALLAPLLRLARDDDPGCRALAVTALGGIGGSEALAAVGAALDDPAPEVREAAARAAASLGHWPSAPALERLLCDPAFAVRREAGLALRSFGAIGRLSLRRALGAPDRYAADMARQLLDLPGAS